MEFFDELSGQLEIQQRLGDLAEFASVYFPDLQVDSWNRRVYSEIDIKKHPARKQIVYPAPRGHSKTTALSQIYPLVTYLRDNNARILIARKSLPMAKEVIKWISDTVTLNEDILKDFGNKKDIPWTTDSLYAKRPKASKDPTFKGIGVAGAITGGHFDLIICDDIVDDENARTEHQRTILTDWFTGTVKPLLEPWGQIIVICTRKHYRDLYGELLDNATWWHPHCRINFEQNHQICGYRAIEKMPDYELVKDEHGKVTDVEIMGKAEALWPEFQSLKRLLLEKESMGTIMFNREYQNDPTGMADLILPESWLQYWDYAALPSEGIMQIPPLDQLYKIAAYDLAASTAPDAHYFGWVVLGRDSAGRIYLLECGRRRMDFPAQLKFLEEMANRPLPPSLHLIEANAYQRSLVQASNWMLNIPVKPINVTGPKDQRTISITPYLESGRIFIHKTQQDFITEYRQFPSGQYDDILDAFVMGITELVQATQGKLDYVMYDMFGDDARNSHSFITRR